MSLWHVEGVTHWSMPVNNLEEAESFYGDRLGLTPVDRLGTARMACFTAGGHHSLLCERAATIAHTFVEDPFMAHVAFSADNAWNSTLSDRPLGGNIL